MILPTSIMWSPSSSKSKWSSIPSSSWSTVSGHGDIDVTSTVLIIKLYMIAPTCPGLTAEQQSYEQPDIIHGHAPPQQYCLRKLGHSASINNNVTLQFKLGCHWPSLCEGVQRITWLLNLAFLWFRWQINLLTPVHPAADTETGWQQYCRNCKHLRNGILCFHYLV